jgi:hypothetical protein
MPSVAAKPDEAGQGGAPRLSLGTFDGPLDLLLGLARAQAITWRICRCPTCSTSSAWR